MDSKNKDNFTTLDILCPKCSESQKINFKENLVCVKCETSFFNKTYTVVSMSAFLWLGGVGVAGFGAHGLLLSSNRYPISVEHSIVESCISSSKKSYLKYYYKTKRNKCINALRKTQDDVDYDDYKKYNYKFVQKFKKYIY